MAKPNLMTGLSGRQAGIALVYLIAIALGLKYGYDVGMQIAGPLIGWVMAVNSALFASFVVSMVVDRLRASKGMPADEP